MTSLKEQTREFSDDALTITVLETATVFDGPDTVYRYDLPAAGIVTGWALDGVVDQVKQMYSLSWPDVEIVVDAAPEPTEALVTALLNKGAAAYPVEAIREAAAEEERAAADPDPTVVRRSDPPGAATRLAMGNRGFVVLAACAAGALLALCGWLLISSGAAPPGAPAAPAGEAAPATTPPASRGPGGQREDADPQIAPENPDPDASDAGENRGPGGGPREVGEFVVDVPAGFRVGPGGDGAELLEDPDGRLRVYLSAADAGGLELEDALVELNGAIREDEALEFLPGGEQGSRITYLERPGDGSEVRWTTWLTDGRHVSVGCHTPAEPGEEELAACERIAASTRLR